jgi:putative exporter of polyketide antibiotics
MISRCSGSLGFVGAALASKIISLLVAGVCLVIARRVGDEYGELKRLRLALLTIIITMFLFGPILFFVASPESADAEMILTCCVQPAFFFFFFLIFSS